ncbi:MAG: HAD hydrolase-like protein, partial [Acidobacteria bacterium]|nr:HAD hydrolase-like protein [Acidobacteriota bacterium]
MPIPRETLAAIELLIFDLDGTLVDSKTDLALSVNAVRELMGLGPLPHELIASYVGQGVTNLIRRALG